MQIQYIITPAVAVKPAYPGCKLEQKVSCNPLYAVCSGFTVGPVKYLPMTNDYLNVNTWY